MSGHFIFVPGKRPDMTEKIVDWDVAPQPKPNISLKLHMHNIGLDIECLVRPFSTSASTLHMYGKRNVKDMQRTGTDTIRTKTLPSKSI